MNIINFQKFSDAYRRELLIAVTKNPEEYYKCPKDSNLIEPYVDGLANRMLEAIQTRDIYSVQLSHAFKKAAKSLGIKPTYRDIHEYLNS